MAINTDKPLTLPTNSETPLSSPSQTHSLSSNSWLTQSLMELQALNSPNLPNSFSLQNHSDFRVLDLSRSAGVDPNLRNRTDQIAENGIEWEGNGAPEIPVCAPTRCPSNAAMKVQKVYRSYRTRRKLADSAVLAEELWRQALDFVALNQSTISFYNNSKPDTPASRWNRLILNASKVGKGLSKDAKAQKLAFQHWIEAIDPRHRYGHSLHLYFDEWRKTTSGQPFFYWLDLGDGKEFDLTECPRSKLRQQCIKYLGPQERKDYEYEVVEGKIVHKLTGKLLDTSQQGSNKWIFVMSVAKIFYAGEKKKGYFHHSSFLAGGATLAAGRLTAEDGVLKSISAYSGHYKPTDDSLCIFVSFLEQNGVNLDQVETQKANEDNERNENEKSPPQSVITEALTTSDSIIPCNRPNEDKESSLETTESKTEYKRTLSGGLQSPKIDVPKTAILERINSKKAAKSYQLGHQLSAKWSTGAGPRIGCVADYPMELRLQALELADLSPRSTCSPSSTASAWHSDYPSNESLQ